MKVTVPAFATPRRGPARGWRIDLIAAAIVLVALGLRVHVASSARYIHDEDNNYIPLSKVISVEPGRLHLPMRAENHGAYPAYLVKASGALFGTSPLGYRLLHVLVSLGTILFVFLLVRDWYGDVAARWAAALIAFNEYYLTTSARVTAHVPHLFFVSATVWAFGSFLRTRRLAYLYATGALVGFAFYIKEHSVLMLPAFFLTLLLPAYRHWLRTPHPYLACLAFVVVVSPDIYWNLTTNWETATVNYGDQEALQATYTNHLRRIGGVGFSPYPFMYYGRTAVRWTYQQVTGSELYDETEEYHAMNPVLGALLLGAVLVTTCRSRGPDGVRGFLLLLFWSIFLFFTFLKKGDPPGRLSPVSWMWVEFTVYPAVMLAGARLAEVSGRWRYAVWGLAGGTLAYSVWTVASWAIRQGG